MKITVYGAGYVGLVSAACFAELGHDVLCADIDAAKIDRLQAADIPFYEPDLAQLVQRHGASQRLTFTVDLAAAVKFSPVQFICVGTPPKSDGASDLQSVFRVAQTIARYMHDQTLIVNKSTVPVGTANQIEHVVQQTLQTCDKSVAFTVASNPEFLREGKAVWDFMHPDRVIVGSEHPHARQVLQTLYQPLCTPERPLLMMDTRTAELSKYAANAMLACRISFMNEMANLAERFDADITQVQQALGYDPRIGPQFLAAGCGYGGSCFPKDVSALLHCANEVNYPAILLQAIHSVNQAQKQVLFNKVKDYFAQHLYQKTIAVWGLAFKPDTDDIREAPSLTLIENLLAAGATVKAYDPQAMSNVAEHFPNQPHLQMATSPLACCNQADALVLVTEWPQFLQQDWQAVQQALRQPVIFDGRNVLDRHRLQQHGFTYRAIGRPHSSAILAQSVIA
ncbi:MAG: nucleotide sugar dehydrogenase [Legionellales bacterium]|nr:nucleotide sugar dehydrogenase [Legionellales bacterium]